LLNERGMQLTAVDTAGANGFISGIGSMASNLRSFIVGLVN